MLALPLRERAPFSDAQFAAQRCYFLTTVSLLMIA